MKNSNKHDLEKTTSNGKGDFLPKSEQIRCKCTHDCCCPNSKSYKKPTKKISNKDLKDTPPTLKNKVSVPELSRTKCPCSDNKVSGKGKKSKSKPPCNKDQDCSCTLPANAVSLRHKITDLDNVLKTQGQGKKRKTKNVQQKSIKISEVYVDPKTNKKSIITLTEKSEVKIEIKTFCDDTRNLEKNKKKGKGKKNSRQSSKSSKSSKSEKSAKGKKSKEKVPQKGKHKKGGKEPKDKKAKKKKGFFLQKGIFGCIKKKHPVSSATESTHASKKPSDVSVVFQTTEGGKAKQTNKDGQCLGIKTFSKTEKFGEGIVNTNTVVFPENFAGNLSKLNSCNTCKEITAQLDKQTKEIDNIRRSIGDCLKLLKSNGPAVYVMSDMTERSNPNYYTVYSHAGKKDDHKKSDKVSENTYDPEHKVRDWITHGSLKQHHEYRETRDRGDKSQKHKDYHQESRHIKERDVKGSKNNKGSRTPDKFDAELEEYLKHCQYEYQVYKSTKESKPPKDKSKASKKAKKSKNGGNEENVENEENLFTGQCDREAVDCQCGPECDNLGVQTSNLSTDPGKKSDKKAKKEAKKEKKRKSKADDNTGDTLSIATEKSEADSVVSGENANSKVNDKAKDLKGKKTSNGCFGKFIKCILCQPY